uniref:Uncharacterized protein n=1 Tax=Spermophilus dauricus TaxID=99837 RepID=A0A8C9Q9J2_SPEDA
MPRGAVKDASLWEFFRALAAFLKRSRKLKISERVDVVKQAKHKELVPFGENLQENRKFKASLGKTLSQNEILKRTLLA